MFEINKLIRPSLRDLKPYSSARDEYEGEAEVYLDANENPEGNYNRYPDPLQRSLKNQIANRVQISSNQIFIGNGSDEVIDLLIRLCCVPGQDQIITFVPTYGMYKVSAKINDIEVLELPMDENFQPIVNADNPEWNNPKNKLLFLCSPNNPTGNLVKDSLVEDLLSTFKGLVVIDEAYIQFTKENSLINCLNKHNNLFVIQTFSKSLGLAGARIGMGFGSVEMIDWLNKIKPPYNVSVLNQEAALKKMLESQENASSEVDRIVQNRKELEVQLGGLKNIIKIYKSDANFLLVEVLEGEKMYNELLRNGIVVRKRKEISANALRVTVGTKEENRKLINVISSLAV
ncbi:MAG: histidinol-phosphate transaminase [Bacteroidetes bacterium]|nr:histidinol-phosphate transaminase [Bacteroidota bacterium]